MKETADVFKALGHHIRLRLFTLLAERDGTCVCHLAEALGEQDFKISRHLRVLRNSGLVEARREGTWMYYSVPEEHSELVTALTDLCPRVLGDRPALQEDRERLGHATCCSQERDTS